ncbi:hypothetical protein [Nonomuraea aurantiaca]|nr:hypothetical protein [Nonomuraea aurantiaca]
MAISIGLLQELDETITDVWAVADVTCCTWTVPTTCLGATFAV